MITPMLHKSNTPRSPPYALERLARTVAGQRIVENGGENGRSVTAIIEATWPQYLDEAVALFNALREPDKAMTWAGNADVWEAMVMAALGNLSCIKKAHRLKQRRHDHDASPSPSPNPEVEGC